MINAAEEVWQHLYTINKTEFEIFRKDGCKNYEILWEIFSGTTTIGGLNNASTKLPSSSNDETQFEDNFQNMGVNVHVVNDDDERMSTRQSGNTSINERRSKKRKANSVEKLESFMEQWSSSINMDNEEAELRVPYLKEKIAKLQGKSPIASDSQSGVSWRVGSIFHCSVFKHIKWY